jgi:hypothetical protein
MGLRSAKPCSRLVDSGFGLAPTVDTNEPGLRRISMNRGGEVSQARDGAGHPEWILQAGGLADRVRSAASGIMARSVVDLRAVAKL